MSGQDRFSLKSSVHLSGAADLHSSCPQSDFVLQGSAP